MIVPSVVATTTTVVGIVIAVEESKTQMEIVGYSIHINQRRDLFYRVNGAKP